MKPPIFVVGTMRSGSTLLRLILDSHPHISIGEETGFMGAVAATKAIPNWRYGREWYGRLGWSEAELDDRLQAFYSGMFERHATSLGKQRWGDKTPLHSWHMEEMARLFPEAVFVAIVRHPGAVVSSLKRRFHWDVGEAAVYWESTNLEVCRQGRDLGAERFALLRYEDLVRETECTLRELISWLGEAWSEDLLRHQEVQSAKGAPRLVDGSTSTRDAISADRVDRWSQGLDEAERDVVQSTTAVLAGFLGYDGDGAREPRGIVPANAHGRHKLLTGDLLGQRRREHGGTVSFESRPQPIAVPEMSTAELAARLRQAEVSLARTRARPVVRFADAARRAQRRVAVPRLTDLLGATRRSSRRRPTRGGN